MSQAVTTIGVLHPGRMGAAFAACAADVKGTRVLWCPAGRTQATHDRARAAGLEPVADLGDLLDAAEVVLSICPPAAAQHVANQVAEHGYRGLYVEANATSPERCERIATRLASRGARVVDGAIFGPPPHQNAPAALYLAGDAVDTEAVAMLFDGTVVEVIKMDGEIGGASALKMAHASYQKGVHILAAVAHALAARYGVTKHLLSEAAHTTHNPLAEPDRLVNVAASAWRWAPELHEIADTLIGNQLPAEFALDAASVLLRWHGDKDDPDLSLETVLDQLIDPA
jgi:3-hydroxyisobutyrate dehydrogenase-like beta-hydroxyacid dehydrogenase